MYSYFVVDKEIEDCLFHSQDIEKLPNKNATPLVLFLSSTLPSQSASVYAIRVKFSPCGYHMLEILHTHLGFLFPKVFPMFISHYSIFYSLGRISSRRIFSSVHTSISSVEWSLDATLGSLPTNVHCPWDHHQNRKLLMIPWSPPHFTMFHSVN